MSENIDNLIIEHLKALRNQVETLQTEMRNEFKDVKQRLHRLDESSLTVRREALGNQEDTARQQVTLDQIIERLNRVEKRLDLS